MAIRAYEGQYQGVRAIWLQAGGFEAAILPEVGANLIALRETARNYHLLREPMPEEMETFLNRPVVHGIPVLFPPNRYDQGTFTLNNRTYHLPVTEPRTNNHIHGFFYNRPWHVDEYGTNADESFIKLSQRVDAEHEVYAYLPHEFTFELHYSLSANGLQQIVNITNQGPDPMPCMLGFHTAINAPFAEDSLPEDYSFTLTTGNRWAMNERMLPTGLAQPLTEAEQQMKTSGVSPFFTTMDFHYSAEPIDGRNAMVLTDRKEQVRLVYDVGTKYKHWMVWNNKISNAYFCPEPQINMVNAPNVDLPREASGLVMLNPGDNWTETSRIYIEEISN